MQVKIGLENGFENKSIAWVLEHPGCFVYGKDGAEAVLRTPQALIAYKDWIGMHTSDSWLENLGDFDVRLTETFEFYTVNAQFDRDPKGEEGINSWFQYDWKPLTKTDIEHGLQVLIWNRFDLLDIVSELTPAQLDKQFEGERWSILGVLRHIANAELYYLDRLGLAGISRAEMAEDTFERLEQNRIRMNVVLPMFEDKKDVRGVDGEFWSPRKILRRTAWHERDHIMHIERLLTLL